MLFNSVFFLFGFLPLFLLGYYVLPIKLRNAFALVASILFYAWGAPRFVLVLLGAVLIDFYLAQQLSRVDGRAKKGWLWLGIGINLSILLTFKYLHFFAEALSMFSSSSISLPTLLLPIGISFFTFHEISYLVDVYRAKRQPFSSFINYALYIFFFPQLVAGPIIRFHEVAEQIDNRILNYTTSNMLNGFFRFMIGLAKKIWIADVIGAEVDALFTAQASTLGFFTAWFVAVFNLIRIYIDFSAYSDMAIGLALMLGFIFPENFNSPFISKTVGEFWERWHMSLGRWMRDYLYLPLGGSRGTLARTCINLMLIFLICGFWHGADVKYVIWGGLFGVAVVAERILQQKFQFQLKGVVGIVVTFFVCIHILVFFSTTDYHHAFSVFQQMYSLQRGAAPLFLSYKVQLALVAATLISFANAVPAVATFSANLFATQRSNSVWVVVGAASVLLLLLNASMLFVSGYHPFLYFKF